MIAQEVAAVFEEIAPRESGVPGDELGFVWGDPATEVKGVGCAWCVDAGSLRQCVERGLNLVICHEALWLPPQKSPWYDGPVEAEIAPNRMRRRLLERNGLVVYRSHSNWDGLPGDGIADSATAALAIAGLTLVSRQKFFAVHELEKPRSVRQLQRIAEKGLGYAESRVFGDARRRVRRFALLIGGFGENQYHMPQAALEMGAEALIIGEMSEFIVIAALELGLPVIETLHSVSEMPGIRRQAAVLAQRLPGVKVEFVPSGALSFAGGGGGGLQKATKRPNASRRSEE
jgi:putative NIF3 family GTP cyclohydrolase 1 type 2